MADWSKLLHGLLRYGFAGPEGRDARNLFKSILGREIQVGTIHDVFAHTNAYVIRLPVGGTRLAAKAGQVSFTPLGAREITQLQIGDSVICYVPEGIPYCYILLALPPQVFDARFAIPDSLVMRSAVGLIEDTMHTFGFQNEKNDLGNFSGGRPADILQGDWGYINELGVAIWLGKLMSCMRASDVAKIEMFWGDDLVRLFGWNLQRFTAGSEKHFFDDEGEYGEVELWTPFIWESLGSYEAGQEVFQDNDGEAGGLKKGSEKSKFEPREEKQSIVFRGLNLRGYLGDASKRMVVLLPSDASGISKTDDAKNYRGVFEEHIGLDGGYRVRSAKEIVFEKSLMMPVPRRLLDPDDPSGDVASGDEANYKAAGQYGDGPDQEKKPYRWGKDAKPDVRHHELWEYQAYLFGKYGLQVIDAHEKDWSTPEESAVKIDADTENQVDPELFTSLDFTYSKDLPQYGQVTIDQRDGHDVRYYQTRSCFHMLDDGSVVIEDGYGSQIIMSGGNIHQTCQGDIFNRPGRSFITWAPRDFIARAGYCAEISAAKQDVRIKAEKNLHLMAGDGSTGSILLECKARGRSAKSGWDGKVGEDIEDRGIILKAEETSINLWAKYLYGGIHKDGAGMVEFNAGSGVAVLAGGKVGHEALHEWSVMVGADRSKASQPPQFVLTPSQAVIRAKTDIVGDLGVWPGSKGSGGVSVGGYLAVKVGMGTEGAIIANGHFVGTTEHVGADASYTFSPSPSSEGQKHDRAADQTEESIFGTFDQDAFDTADSPGNQELWDAVGFSFRKTNEHYQLDEGFQIYESRWQQLYRIFGGNRKWDEPIVESPSGVKTRPHPGHEAWESSPHYNYTTEGTNVDLNRGISKDREEQTEQGVPPLTATLKDEYLVNVQE